MNNILRIISDLQQSCEYDIPMLPHVQKYLNSVQYIEELQKFVEDDNYKLSLKIEPGTSTPRSAASREDLVGPEVGASPQSGRKSSAAEGPLLPQTPPSPRHLIPHGHRKCHSLGYNFIHKMNTAEFKSATFPNAGPRHLLDDSVMEPHAPSRGQAESSTLSSGISIGSILDKFKSTSNKNVSVVGWMVMMADDPEHPDLFLLTDSEKGSYKLDDF
ncbi:hypothetical protein A6R68_09490 [Neotoma lepida]|uniref:Ras-GEF domain-containing protein n=1 Tax=Neotoma lepida TaxID=56216 RepID=A0A1A6G0Q5_NEOLE|nr:hypothetical protein A6R68_09490 [Neotoma lepida]